MCAKIILRDTITSIAKIKGVKYIYEKTRLFKFIESFTAPNSR